MVATVNELFSEIPVDSYRFHLRTKTRQSSVQPAQRMAVTVCGGRSMFNRYYVTVRATEYRVIGRVIVAVVTHVCRRAQHRDELERRSSGDALPLDAPQNFFELLTDENARHTGHGLRRAIDRT